jgi:hypothetical protein
MVRNMGSVYAVTTQCRREIWDPTLIKPKAGNVSVAFNEIEENMYSVLEKTLIAK